MKTETVGVEQNKSVKRKSLPSLLSSLVARLVGFVAFIFLCCPRKITACLTMRVTRSVVNAPEVPCVSPTLNLILLSPSHPVFSGFFCSSFWG